MDGVVDFLNECLAVVLLPATLYGAGGAVMHARSRGKPLRQSFFEVLGGALTANMLCPIVSDYAPANWHYTLFFFVGWGGLEFVGRSYEAFAKSWERRITQTVGGDKAEPDSNDDNA